MARFIFKLQPVLRQRLLTEQHHQREVADLERQRLALEARVREYQRGIAQERHDLTAFVGARGVGGTGSQGVNLGDVRVQANATLHLVLKAQRAVIELSGQHQRLAAARAKLIEATTARRAIERLKERRYEAWRDALNRKEAAELDEIGTSRAARRSTCVGGALEVRL